ncbi:hypothetical protein JA1_000196 [Spathaspora sp. JA1]|nr:hypothetical protein JA1_000196 [Spathaspora sp. JA1]
MYKPKFKPRPNTSGFIISKPTIDLSHIRTEISQIPTFKRKVVYLYKQFYKLRDIQYDKQYWNTKLYEAVLLRNFKHISFNNRRRVILSTTDELNEEELVERMLNTLAFVFNSTVYSDDPRIFNEILNFDDLNKAKKSTIEADVIGTILRLDGIKPNVIKYDFKYQWWKQLRDDLNKVQDWDNISRKQLKSLKLEWISFYQYETTLMRLNENLKLCL